MQNDTVQAVPSHSRNSHTRRRVLIGTILVICIACIASTAAWVSAHSPSSPTEVGHTNVIVHDSVPRSAEIPLSMQRSFSSAQSSAPTTELPWGIALDSAHGYTWVAEPGCEPLPTCPSASAGIIGQYAYSDGKFIQDFTEPKGYTNPLFLVADSAGRIWFTQPNSDAIGEFDPQHTTWHQWSTKKNSQPYDIALDPHGNLWFTEYGGNQIGFLNTTTGKVVETPVPLTESDPYGITIAKNGVVWFTENKVNSSAIASFPVTTTGKIVITEHTVSALRPHLITTDAAGNVWFTEGFAGYISEYIPSTGVSNRYLAYLGACLDVRTCTGTHISGIRVDNKGNVWFTDSLSQRVGYLIPSTGQLVVQNVGVNAHPHDGLVLDNNGRIWFTEQYALTLNVWPITSVK